MRYNHPIRRPAASRRLMLLAVSTIVISCSSQATTTPSGAGGGDHGNPNPSATVTAAAPVLDATNLAGVVPSGDQLSAATGGKYVLYHGFTQNPEQLARDAEEQSAKQDTSDACPVGSVQAVQDLFRADGEVFAEYTEEDRAPAARA